MKKRQVSHIPRTRDWLFGNGCELVGIVERRIPHGVTGFSHRSDLYGLADLEAIHDGKVIWVQVCSQSTLAAHKRKATENPDLLTILSAGRFVIVAWSKNGSRWAARCLEAVPDGRGGVEWSYKDTL